MKKSELLKCAVESIKSAREIHDMHLNDSSTANDESQKQLMGYILKSERCIEKLKEYR